MKTTCPRCGSKQSWSQYVTCHICGHQFAAIPQHSPIYNIVFLLICPIIVFMAIMFHCKHTKIDNTIYVSKKIISNRINHKKQNTHSVDDHFNWESINFNHEPKTTMDNDGVIHYPDGSYFDTHSNQHFDSNGYEYYRYDGNMYYVHEND